MVARVSEQAAFAALRARGAVAKVLIRVWARRKGGDDLGYMGVQTPAICRALWSSEKLPSDRVFRAPAILVAVILGAVGGAARAQVNISPQALAHRAYCIEQAEQNDLVFLGAYVLRGERGITYRCRDEVAVAYFNDLGRRRRRADDRVESNVTGVYVLRPIYGVGYCWHKIGDENRLPVSFWGCDVFVAY